MDDDIRQYLAAGEFDAAFEQILARYQDKVFRLSYGMLRNETQAQDTAQDVFVKIWKALPGFAGTASLASWIYTITRNTCLTELKRRRPTVSLEEPGFGAPLDSQPELQTAAPEPGIESDLEHWLAQLPEHYRLAIALFYLEQKSYEDVAAQMDIPIGTVKTYLHRAKKLLLRISTRSINLVAP
jgi:RNA polymerase sigma-70 factor (ECF subfamily)